MNTIQCPKCRQPVAAAGTLQVDGVAMTVYQCDRCVVPWQVEGQAFPSALTFAVDADGNYLDAETLDPLRLPADPSAN